MHHRIATQKLNMQIYAKYSVPDNCYSLQRLQKGLLAIRHIVSGWVTLFLIPFDSPCYYRK